MKVYTEKDMTGGDLGDRRIVVLGYGNQGRPQALNLRDSGLNVAVAARPGGKAQDRAEEDGFEVLGVRDGCAEAQILMCLLPDEVQGQVYRDEIAPVLKRGSTICFAHGFSVAFGSVRTALFDLIMVAPKGQGSALRSAYLDGTGIPCLVAVENDLEGEAFDTAMGIAGGLGCLRVGAFETTFREEAVSDIFGEQSILVGGVPALVKEAFIVLVENGFSPEVAYFECVHELKIIVDLIIEHGIAGMRELISGTAAYGGLAFGERVVTPEASGEMRKMFERIDSGEFAERWLEEAAGGKKRLAAMIADEKESEIERAGREVRKLFTKRIVERKSGGDL